MAKDEDLKERKKDVWAAVMEKDPGGTGWALQVSIAGKVLRSVRIDPEATYIGRMAENHVVLDDPKVSRSHARITASPEGVLLEDQESENGVYLNGARVEKAALKMGDKIAIGGHVLEIVPAPENARLPVAGADYDEIDADWRMNQTVNITGEALDALRAQGMKRPALPTFGFSLKVGESRFDQEVTFDRGRKREAKDGEGNFVEVRICLGKWVLYKKIPV